MPPEVLRLMGGFSSGPDEKTESGLLLAEMAISYYFGAQKQKGYER